MSGDVVTGTELARLLNRKPATLRAMARRGDIPCVRDGHAGGGRGRGYLFDVEKVRARLAERAGAAVFVPTFDGGAVARGLRNARAKALEGWRDPVWQVLRIPRAAAAAVLGLAYESIVIEATGKPPEDMPEEIRALLDIGKPALRDALKPRRRDSNGKVN